MKILVTGGAGYIGSHTVVELIHSGYDVVIADNFNNSKVSVIGRLETITGKPIPYYKVELTNKDEVMRLFAVEKFDGVIHFAGLKSVPESVKLPTLYYYNNLVSTLNVLDAMIENHVSTFVFSSSATVYGNPKIVPIPEDSFLHTTNPYGSTKLMIEQILGDVAKAHPDFKIAALRYFNPIGAHESGLIGEDPNGLPNNLVPYLTQVLIGKLPKLTVYGNDYDTKDGTGVRDYIHVCDLAAGHVSALRYLQARPGFNAFNLGTGEGYSVLELIHTFEEVTGKQIPFQIGPRRPGDIATSFADPSKALKELGWQATRDLKTMATDSWRWQSKNPLGYE